MKRKIVLILIIAVTLTSLASIHRHYFKNKIPFNSLQYDSIPKKDFNSKSLNEYLVLAEKFMKNTTLSFEFDYTVYAGTYLNEIAEQIKGHVWKSDTFYKMIDEHSKLVIDSILSVSIDHQSKNLMVTWASMMDRRFNMFINMKEIAEESAEIESVVDQSKTGSGYKTFKINSNIDKGYYLIDIDSISCFPRKIEIFRPSNGYDTYDDSRIVINYRNMSNSPIQASEFSYTQYFELEPEFRVANKFLTYDLLTNL